MEFTDAQLKVIEAKAAATVERDWKLLDISIRQELGMPLKEEHFLSEQDYINYLADEKPNPLCHAPGRTDPNIFTDKLGYTYQWDGIHWTWHIIAKPVPEKSAFIKILDAADSVMAKWMGPVIEPIVAQVEKQTREMHDNGRADKMPEDAGVQNKQSMARLDNNLKKITLGVPEAKPAESYWQPGKAPWEIAGYKSEADHLSGLMGQIVDRSKHDQTADNANKAYSALADMRVQANRANSRHTAIAALTVALGSTSNEDYLDMKNMMLDMLDIKGTEKQA